MPMCGRLVTAQDQVIASVSWSEACTVVVQVGFSVAEYAYAPVVANGEVNYIVQCTRQCFCTLLHD